MENDEFEKRFQSSEEIVQNVVKELAELKSIHDIDARKESNFRRILAQYGNYL